MKNYLTLLLLFICILSGNAQTKETEIPITIESVSKKWVFSDVINPALSKEQYEEMAEMLAATEIEFRKDMTFTFSFIADLEGTWSLNKNVITTKDRRGKTTWTIHQLKSNEIIMSRDEAVQKIVFKAK